MRQITSDDRDTIIRAEARLTALRDDYFDGKPDDFKPDTYRQISDIIQDLIALEGKLQDILEEQKYMELITRIMR